MKQKLSGIGSLDYTIGVIDGLKWCLNCGAVASASEIAAQIKKIQAIEENTLSEMEKDFSPSDNTVNNTYDVIIAQILETFPNACNITKRGVFKESAVVEFTPYEGSTIYSATLFSDSEKIVVAIVI